jgi:Phosphatidylinositol-4-phosphate 5-Kinase
VDCQHKRNLRQAVLTLDEQERILQKFQAGKDKKLDSATLYRMTLPIRLLVAPPLYLARKAWFLGRLTMDSIFTSPLPYYGSGSCVVDGGKFSVFHGERRGERAIYYMGLIDFLQPWTKRKVVERYLKGIIGYDTDAISSVTPEEYATRFLAYLDDNIT